MDQENNNPTPPITTTTTNSNKRKNEETSDNNNETTTSSSTSSSTTSKRVKVNSGNKASSSQKTYEEILKEEEKEATLPPNNPRNWRRPHVPQIDVETMPIAFQWMDIDMYEGEPLEENPKIMADLPGSTNKPVPIVRLYGVTEVGNSVLAHIHGFTPYFICTIPRSFDPAHVSIYIYTYYTNIVFHLLTIFLHSLVLSNNISVVHFVKH